MRFALKRLGFYAIAAFFSVTVNFVLPRLMPGDAASALFARYQGRLSPEAVAALRQAFGAGEGNALQQYVAYLGHVLTGDLGVSVVYFPARVTDVIATGLGWTVLLAGTAVLVSFTLGTALGVLTAWRRGGIVDVALPPILSLLGAFPYFFLAMGALFLLGFEWGWFPTRHAYSDEIVPAATPAFLFDVVEHAFLPVGSVVLATLGGWTLGMRNTMVAVLGTEPIALARAKGLPTARIVWSYAARNALLPSITGFGMALGFVLGGSLLTEIVFSYPGLGFLLVQAVRSQDFPLMQGLFLMITLAVLAANWAVDLVSLWLDPRTRGQSRRPA